MANKKTSLKQFSLLNTKSKLTLVGVIVLFALTMTYLLLISRAASSSVSLEAETFDLTDSSVGTDSTASGNKYVELGIEDSGGDDGGDTGGGDNGGEPPTTPPGEWPDATNTGIAAAGLTDSDLTSSGSITVTQDGTVINKKKVTGTIRVEANNVTIKNSKIVSNGARYGIEPVLGENVTGLTIENVTITSNKSCGSNQNSAGIVHYGEFVAKRVNVSNFIDGIKIGTNQTVQDSWIHDMLKCSGSHNDGMQSVGGRNVNILRNNVEGPWQESTSALILTANTTPYLEDYTIEGNRLSGGTFTVYVTAKDGKPSPKNIVIRNNMWVGYNTKTAEEDPRNSWKYGPLSTKNNPQLIWSGNTWADGSPYSN